MGVVGRLDQYASMLVTEFDETTANNPSITGLGTYYASEFSENVGIATTLAANVFAPYDPVYDEFGGTLFGAGQGRYMRQNTDKSVIVYNEIDEITDFRDIVRSGLVLDLDAGMALSYPGYGDTIFNLVPQTSYPSISLFGDPLYGNITNGVVNISGAGNSTSSGMILRGLGNLASTINSNFTTIGWLYRTVDRADEVMSYREGSYRCAFTVNNSLMYFVQRETFDPFTSNSTSVVISTSLNTWYCYALTRSANSWSFYLNGSLIGTNTFTMTQTISSGAFHVGYAYTDDDFLSNGMNGSVGPIMHYTRALTQSEITQNFNALRHRFGL
jgi:hypothetical protein